MAKTSKIPELSGIEFNGHASVKHYSETARTLFREIAWEFEFASGEIQAALARQSGHPLLFGLDVRVRARRVARRLDRIAQLAGGAAVESVRFYAEFRTQFAPVIQPPKAKKPERAFDFNDHD